MPIKYLPPNLPWLGAHGSTDTKRPNRRVHWQADREECVWRREELGLSLTVSYLSWTRRPSASEVGRKPCPPRLLAALGPKWDGPNPIHRPQATHVAWREPRIVRPIRHILPYFFFSVVFSFSCSDFVFLFLFLLFTFYHQSRFTPTNYRTCRPTCNTLSHNRHVRLRVVHVGPDVTPLAILL